MPSFESTGSKIVQTELDGDTYERLKRLSDQEDTSLKDLTRTAIAEYVRRHLRHAPDDPLFTATPGTGSRETDAGSTDEYLAESIDERD